MRPHNTDTASCCLEMISGFWLLVQLTTELHKTWPSPPIIEWRQYPAVSETLLSSTLGSNLKPQNNFASKGPRPLFSDPLWRLESLPCAIYPEIHSVCLTVLVNYIIWRHRRSFLNQNRVTSDYIGIFWLQYRMYLYSNWSKHHLYLWCDRNVTCGVNLHAGHTCSIISHESRAEYR